MVNAYNEHSKEKYIHKILNTHINEERGCKANGMLNFKSSINFKI